MPEQATRRKAAPPKPAKDRATAMRTPKKGGASPAVGSGKTPKASAESAQARNGKKPASAEGKVRSNGAAKKPASAEGKARASAAKKPASAEGKAHASAAKKPASAEGKARANVAKKPASAEGKVRSNGPAKKPASTKKNGRATARKSAKVQPNPVARAANEKNAPARRRAKSDDLFLERSVAPAPKPAASNDGTPPEKGRTLFGALNACLAIAIAVVVAMGLRLQNQYADFRMMRDVVDKQTFYEGTTVEGVDVSKMTLSNAMDYWRDRVEARNAGRTVTLDDGTTVTAGELGYTSDYQSVLTTAWSHGRNGTLEERYRMASSRMQNPAAYAIHRTEYNDALVDQFVQMQALKIDQDPVNASVASFDVDTYEFTFNPSTMGRQLDEAALKQDVVAALAAGGGNVTMAIAEQPPEITTDVIGGMYGLIDYAITNASSSSRSRLNNITLAMSMINGAKLAPGETFSFNEQVGKRTADRGFKMATAYSGGEVTEQLGGGICQVSTTLFNAAVKSDMQIDERHNHSLTVHYVDKGKDATVDWGHQDLKFTNTSPDDIYICCYLTDDKRVRFGIFGRLLPNGEKITLEAVTTEAIKYQTEYQPTTSLPSGQTKVYQNGRDGYKAEAYKVRWDAYGNELSRELLCTSVYKSKNEIVLYGT